MISSYLSSAEPNAAPPEMAAEGWGRPLDTLQMRHATHKDLASARDALMAF